MNKSKGGKEAILVHEHLKEETNLNVHVEQTNNIHQSHKQQFVEKYPHIIRNFLTYWFKDWAKNQSSIYEILHRTLLSYTVILKSSLNYSSYHSQASEGDLKHTYTCETNQCKVPEPELEAQTVVWGKLSSHD